jgi:hypothetical protein
VGSKEVTSQKISNGGLFMPNGRGKGARATSFCTPRGRRDSHPLL